MAIHTETVRWDKYEHAEEAELARLRDERLRLEGRIEGIQEALGHYRNLKRQGILSQRADKEGASDGNSH